MLLWALSASSSDPLQQQDGNYCRQAGAALSTRTAALEPGNRSVTAPQHQRDAAHASFCKEEQRSLR